MKKRLNYRNFKHRAAPRVELDELSGVRVDRPRSCRINVPTHDYSWTLKRYQPLSIRCTLAYVQCQWRWLRSAIWRVSCLSHSQALCSFDRRVFVSTTT